MGRVQLPQLQSLQALRGLAALAVLLFHAAGIAAAYGFSPLITTGAWGVDVFFVVSGVLMAKIAKHGDDRGAFLVRRLWRIAPLYWIVTTAKLAAMIMVPTAFALQIDAMHVVTSYVFLPWPDQTGALHPVLYVGWTLSFEVWFYALFALCGFSTNRVALSVGGLVIAGFDPVALEFVAGIAIARTFDGKEAGVPWLVATLALAYPESRALYWGLPCAAVVCACMLAEGRWSPGFATRLGDASYSLYLTHTLVLPPLFILARACSLSTALAMPGAVVLALLVGAWTHRLVERPLLLLRPVWAPGLRARTAS